MSAVFRRPYRIANTSEFVARGTLTLITLTGIVDANSSRFSAPAQHRR